MQLQFHPTVVLVLLFQHVVCSYIAHHFQLILKRLPLFLPVSSQFLQKFLPTLQLLNLHIQIGIPLHSLQIFDLPDELLFSIENLFLVLGGGGKRGLLGGGAAVLGQEGLGGGVGIEEDLG